MVDTKKYKKVANFHEAVNMLLEKSVLYVPQEEVWDENFGGHYIDGMIPFDLTTNFEELDAEDLWDLAHLTWYVRVNYVKITLEEATSLLSTGQTVYLSKGNPEKKLTTIYSTTSFTELGLKDFNDLRTLELYKQEQVTGY